MMKSELFLESLDGNIDYKKRIYFDGKNILSVNKKINNNIKCNGWFENFETGIFKKKMMDIFVFCYKGDLYISFDDAVFKEAEITFSRYYIFTRIKKFKVFHKGKCVVNFNYLFKFFNDDPFARSDFLYELISIKRNNRQKTFIDDWCRDETKRGTNRGQAPR